MKTLKDIDLAGKTVLVRVDYNVLDKEGRITETYRLEKSLPTLKYLQEHNCKIVLISHAGRPNGRVVPQLSLKPVADKLAELSSQRVEFVKEYISETAKKVVSKMLAGQVVLLENLRFHPGEETNDKDFAKQLAGLAEVFIQDGFGVVHRAHASTSAITEFLPSVAGLLLEKEFTAITNAMDNPGHPFVAIVGGAKVSDKIELLRRLAKRADSVLIGGAMANTFLKEYGLNIGKSVFESGQTEAVQSLAEYKDKIVLPQRISVGQSLGVNTLREDKELEDVDDSDYILDNDFSTAFDKLAGAKTVIWNGPVGMTEFDNFKHGSMELANAIINSDATSVIGGGDTAAFIVKAGLSDKFTWVSTGGGSALELMAGKKLPGIEALNN